MHRYANVCTNIKPVEPVGATTGWTMDIDKKEVKSIIDESLMGRDPKNVNLFHFIQDIDNTEAVLKAHISPPIFRQRCPSRKSKTVMFK